MAIIVAAKYQPLLYRFYELDTTGNDIYVRIFVQSISDTNCAYVHGRGGAIGIE